jgi:hypothetical protein
MKTILFFLLLTSNSLTINAQCEPDSLYKRAFSYIINSGDIKAIFGDYIHDDSLNNIFISDKILRQSRSIFVKEIIKEEYSYVTEKDSLEDKLRDEFYRCAEITPLVLAINYCLKNIHYVDSSFKLLMYFTLIENNKFMARIGLYDEFTKDEPYNNTIVNTPISLLYMFYFKDNKIYRTFKSVLYH